MFTLRRGVRFHDGNEMTAEDVKVNLDRLRDPTFGSPNRTKLDSVQEIRVRNPCTLPGCPGLARQPSCLRTAARPRAAAQGGAAA